MWRGAREEMPSAASLREHHFPVRISAYISCSTPYGAKPFLPLIPKSLLLTSSSPHLSHMSLVLLYSASFSGCEHQPTTGAQGNIKSHQSPASQFAGHSYNACLVLTKSILSSSPRARSIHPTAHEHGTCQSTDLQRLQIVRLAIRTVVVSPLSCDSVLFTCCWQTLIHTSRSRTSRQDPKQQAPPSNLRNYHQVNRF